jgi:hypothetical protein
VGGGKVSVLKKEVIPSEDHEQAIFVQWFRRTYPNVLIFSIPTGGHRHIAVATKMKVTGAVKGIPDLFVPEWKLWIEMKRTKGGVVSAEQKGIMAYLQSVGYRAIVCKGAEDAKAQILEFLNEERT